MLVAWYAMMEGIAAWMPETVMKTPTYWPHGFFTKPMIGRPMRAMMMRPQSTGPRLWYLSLNHAEPYMRKPAKAYGGAPMHCDIAIENLSLVLRMIGRKKANPYATVEVAKRRRGKA
jgi:hypothetical protein